MFPSIGKLSNHEKQSMRQLLRRENINDPDALLASLERTFADDARLKQPDGIARQGISYLLATLAETPDPMRVAVAFERFVRSSPDRFGALQQFGRTPRAVEILARIASGSPFLTQTLIRYPQHLWQLVDRTRRSDMQSRGELIESASAACEADDDEFPAGQNIDLARHRQLRKWQLSELLRIGVSDAFGLLNLRLVTLQLTLLADAIIEVCLRQEADRHGLPPDTLTVLSVGKHGGEELNYSSDIDLILVANRTGADVEALARSLVERLSQTTADGFLYRVDLRLRPWGSAGPLLTTCQAFEDYLTTSAVLWEKQSLLKARPVAGNLAAGRALLQSIQPLIFSAPPHEVRDNVRRMKDRIEELLNRSRRSFGEVKLGAGSIRDVEFIVQYLQLIHGRDEPRVRSPNTLIGLRRLAEFGFVNSPEFQTLNDAYVFLRVVEHSLQLAHDQQVHALPGNTEELDELAVRLDYPDGKTLLNRYRHHRNSVRAAFDRYFREDDRHVAPTAAVLPPDRQTSAGESMEDVESCITTLLRTPISGRTPASRLSSMTFEIHENQPARVAMMSLPGESRQLALIAGSDVSGATSAACGLLLANGFNIINGEALTGPGRLTEAVEIPAGQFALAFEVQPAMEAARNFSFESRFRKSEVEQSLEQELSEALMQLRTGDRDTARRRILHRACQRIAFGEEFPDPPSDADIRIRPLKDTAETEVTISASDAPGFLFELTNALSVCGFTVRRAILRSQSGRLNDVFHVRERERASAVSVDRLEELRLAVALIRQFIHQLPSSNEPYAALRRFQLLLKRVHDATAERGQQQSWSRPHVLATLARILGSGRSLWENFLRLQPEELLELVANSAALEVRIPVRKIEQEIAGILETDAIDPAERKRLLNRAKDRHLCRIQVRRILGFCKDIEEFSAELTELADLLLASTSAFLFRLQSTAFGLPLCITNDAPCEWCLVGLGKLGSGELGFASDLEMMLVYREDGQTSGARPISNSDFFQRLIVELVNWIEPHDDGLFRIDLRVRPFGASGSLAVTRRQLLSYFALDGPAWPYERQSMTRLRRIAGGSSFSDTFHEEIAGLIFEPRSFDFVALEAMRERQLRQHVADERFDAKLGHGGLVDCEYFVQAMQLLHGGAHPSLRSGTTSGVLMRLGELRLLPSDIVAGTLAAHQFMRELIDSLRIIRGKASGTTLPATEDDAFLRLARSMNEASAHDLADGIQRHSEMIRRFAETVRSTVQG